MRCYDGSLSLPRAVWSARLGRALAVVVTASVLFAVHLASQTPPNTYTVIAADGRRSLANTFCATCHLPSIFRNDR